MLCWLRLFVCMCESSYHPLYFKEEELNKKNTLMVILADCYRVGLNTDVLPCSSILCLLVSSMTSDSQTSALRSLHQTIKMWRRGGPAISGESCWFHFIICNSFVAVKFKASENSLETPDIIHTLLSRLLHPDPHRNARKNKSLYTRAYRVIADLILTRH